MAVPVFVGNVKDSAFMYNGLHFSEMKLASEKPPEAVLEGEIFLGEHAPRPPYIMACKARHPSSLMRIWPDRFFLASYSPVSIHLTLQKLHFGGFLGNDNCLYPVQVRMLTYA